jgi:hypothetical protein
MRRLRRLALATVLAIAALPVPSFAQQALVIRSLAEKRVTALPEGVLFWRVDKFATQAAALAAAGPFSLAVDADGNGWLFTLGPSGGTSNGGTRMAEIGPIPRVTAAEYLLRINDASGPPGSITPVHSHPGSEAFFVLSGEQSIAGTHGTMRVNAGAGEAGHGAGQAMQVSSSGATDLHALVMFVVDAQKPFSTPGSLP